MGFGMGYMSWSSDLAWSVLAHDGRSASGQLFIAGFHEPRSFARRGGRGRMASRWDRHLPLRRHRMLSTTTAERQGSVSLHLSRFRCACAVPVDQVHWKACAALTFAMYSAGLSTADLVSYGSSLRSPQLPLYRSICHASGAHVRCQSIRCTGKRVRL